MKEKTITCWIVTEGIAGTENQCLGVAQALNVEPIVKRIGLREPWKTLSPYLGYEQSWTFTGDKLFTNSDLEIENRHINMPDLVLAGGRKAIAACRYIKKQSPQTKIVFFQSPRIDDDCFDLIIAPKHDGLSNNSKFDKRKIFETIGAPNKITDDQLHTAKNEFSDLFGTSAQPIVSVLIGGNSKHHTYTAENNDQIIAHIKTLSSSGYKVYVTASRRTGEDNRQKLMKALSDTNTYFWDGTGANPYFAMLASADYVLVTEDSVSMLCDALTAGKPTYLLKLDGHSDKTDKLHQYLQSKDMVRFYDGQLKKYSYPPLTDSKDAANEILSRFF